MDTNNIFELAKNEVSKQPPITEKEENKYMFCLQCLNELSTKCGNKFSEKFMLDTYKSVYRNVTYKRWHKVIRSQYCK